MEALSFGLAAAVWPGDFLSALCSAAQAFLAATEFRSAPPDSLLLVLALVAGFVGAGASVAMAGATSITPGKFTELAIELAPFGGVQLAELLAQNAETHVYRTSDPRVLVKLFDLDCGKADEVSYGPYMDFSLEIANFDDLLHIEELGDFTPRYYGAKVDSEKKLAYIAMEFVQGQDLTSWCRQGAELGYSPDWIELFRSTIYETLSIMRLFHKHGIVLIDFKPEDILRLPDQRIKFLDLGAFFTPRQAEQGKDFVYSTTPEHAELSIDAANLPTGVPLTKASDIFSAGVALFEMAAGSSRLAIDGATADEILASPEIFLFRNSQIRDVWRSSPELKEAVPLIDVQLQQRQILFSEFWHVLKGYLAHKLADWPAMSSEQHDQTILTTGTTFISEQLPPRLQWLAPPIAQATVLRSLRLKTVADLMRLLEHPASETVREDIRRFNSVIQYLIDLDQPVEFIKHLNTWEVRWNPNTRHWALAAPLTFRHASESARFTFLRLSSATEDGHRFYEITDDFHAEDFENGKLSLWSVRNDHFAWIGTGTT